VQQALQTAQNQSTAGANELIAVSVVIPSAQETQNVVNAVTGQGASTPPIASGTPTGGPPSGDYSGPSPITPPPPTPTTCATPPCEEGGAALRSGRR
jgi:hypothetical protein